MERRMYIEDVCTGDGGGGYSEKEIGRYVQEG
jgi:hypothetical protein